MMKISKKLSYEHFQNVLLWLLITSGAIKPFFVYLNAPFDWTLLVFLLVVLDIIFSLKLRQKAISVNKEKLLVISLLSVLCFVILISLTYTPSSSFSIEKTYLFSINILFFSYPLFIKRINWELQYKLFLILLVPLVIWFILFKALYFSSLNSGYRIVNIRFYDIRRNYLGFGMCLCLLTFIQVYLKKPIWVSIFSILLLFGLGARGALIFLLFALIIWRWKSFLNKILNFRIKTKALRTIIIALVFLPIVVISQYEKISNFLYLGAVRFQSLFKASADNSVQGRIERISFALENIFDSVSTFLFGNGIGSFGILYTGKDVREYPHNIFLEILFELGIFALLLFILFLFLPFLFKRLLFLKFVALFFLLNAMKSGDLVGLWLLFFFIGLLVFNPKTSNEINV